MHEANIKKVLDVLEERFEMLLQDFQFTNNISQSSNRNQAFRRESYQLFRQAKIQIMKALFPKSLIPITRLAYIIGELKIL